MTKKINIAVVGIGLMGLQHIKAIQKSRVNQDGTKKKTTKRKRKKKS